MHNEDRNGFTAKDILIQLLFIILFVFIMVWLFPTKSNMTNLSNKMDILTSTIYNTNLQTMKDAAVSYYTVERLPQALNDSERMTLKEMLDKNLLVDFVDGNGNKCDVNASYVEVLKLENEYQMKINLSCTDRDAYIIVHLGCYDYCKAVGVCQKEEETTIVDNKCKESCTYEYLKVENGKWGDYGAWSTWSTTQVNQTDYRYVETKTSTVTKNVVEETGHKTETVDAIATTVKYCVKPYKDNGKTCTRTAEGYYMAQCPTGYTLNADGTCTGTVTVEYKDSPVCPSNDYVRQGTTCYINATTFVSETPYCENGKLVDNTCVVSETPKTCNNYGEFVKRIEIKMNSVDIDKVPTNDGSSKYYYKYVNYRKNTDCGNACEYVYTVVYDMYKQTCTGGSRVTETPKCHSSNAAFNGTTCIKPSTSTVSVAATCKSGELHSDGLCYSYGKQSKTVASICPTGFTLSGNKCYGTKEITTDYSTSVSYSCPAVNDNNPYQLSGAKCTRTVSIKKTVPVTENVLYYRYKERTYLSGKKLTEWSSSQKDTYLISQGYSLTGNKKCVKVK